jgi:hypothetical protein
MTVIGTILTVKRPHGAGYKTNVWNVRFRFRLDGKLIEREQLVSGVNTCSGEEGEWSAALSVAASYQRPIKILSVTFVGSANVTGHYEELLNAKFSRTA